MNIVEQVYYWKLNPYSFIDEYFGSQLYWYQKIHLWMLCNRRLNGLYDILLQRKYAAR